MLLDLNRVEYLIARPRRRCSTNQLRNCKFSLVAFTCAQL
jgi:hypothetical protein